MRALLLSVVLAGPVMAQPASEPPAVVAARTIRAQSIIEPGDLVAGTTPFPGALVDPAEGIGREARVTLYAGRPVQAADLVAPALVDRNQTIPLIYSSGPLTILAEGRALSRGGEGEVIRVMNLESRMTVTGRVAADGAVHVGPEN